MKSFGFGKGSVFFSCQMWQTSFFSFQTTTHSYTAVYEIVVTFCCILRSCRKWLSKVNGGSEHQVVPFHSCSWTDAQRTLLELSWPPQQFFPKGYKLLIWVYLIFNFISDSDHPFLVQENEVWLAMLSYYMKQEVQVHCNKTVKATLEKMKFHIVKFLS